MKHVTLNKALYEGELCGLFPNAGSIDPSFSHDFSEERKTAVGIYSDDDDMKAQKTLVRIERKCRRCGYVQRSY